MMATLTEKQDFQGFVQKLKSKDDRAWESLRFVLKRLVVYWLVQKGMTKYEAQWLYDESLTTFFQHIHKCEFADFKKLKSYFLAIVDRKYKEANRKKHNPRFVSIDDSPMVRCPIQVWNEEIAESVEKKLLVETLLTHLKKNEQIILFKYFYEAQRLNEIAKEIGTTEENCRILKYRALKKLELLIEKLEK
jgi:RNA polymerase sigma factor (sigma-70 family)